VAGQVRVLVVDDSAFMRKALKRMLNLDPAIKVVADAKDGAEALKKIQRLKPDVVTLDVKMPVMDGLQTLEKIMQDCPTPVLMVSSLTNEGGGITMRALASGAVDFIDKSSCHTVMDIIGIADSLVEKVKIIAGVDIGKLVKKSKVEPLRREIEHEPIVSADVPSHIVAVGASTGGPMSLETVLKPLSRDYPGAIMVVQHMPVGFTASFADRLNNICSMTVTEAKDNDPILPGNIYIAPGGYHLLLKRSNDKFFASLSKYPCDVAHIPSVDVMMKSVAAIWPGRIMGIILTGMGQDGVEGVRAIKGRGGEVLAQNEATCVVYGMPKAAKQSGCVDRMVPLNCVAREISRFG